MDGVRPDRSDVTGALVCLVGVGLIMYAPRGGQQRENNDVPNPRRPDGAGHA
ncbi:hypothetical protein I3F58_00370 [Streptomyces sp. MUM 203J]|nr:hypothetical protein [Streptomyces sp. MUM 203J]